MSEQNQRADELFDKLSQDKKKRKRKLIRTVAILLVVIAVALVITVLTLRRNVEQRFAGDAAEVQAYEVTTGTIHTVVAGSGVLTEVDLEEMTVPAGVEILDVLVDSGDTVAAGELLATVDMATVMTAMSSLQEQLDDLDDDINSAKGEEASTYITAGVSGRVKRIFGEKDMEVSACMAENGALAVLSLDGYMAVKLDAGTLERGDAVTVARENGTVYTGTVESVINGEATVLVTDNGPAYDEEVTVLDAAGKTVGSGKLYIHSPLAVTGYAGTISRVAVQENASVGAWSTIFNLKDTSFSASYDSLLRQRQELEETLLSLLTIYRDGAVLAPMDGRISSVEYVSENEYTVDEDGNTNLLNLYPNLTMSITIGIDETDILALEEGQSAEVTVNSVSEDDVFDATVTEISKVANTTSGVTQYSAEVTLDRAEGMLPGMTADVDVKIEGVENALIIPVDALHQTSTIYYVYTSYDEESQQYGGRTEVTIGMQNDNYVEIQSGLKEGDTVYYVEQEEFGFFFGGFANMGGMGGMSSGGGMSGNMGNRNGGGGGMPSGGGGGMPGGGPSGR